MKRFAQVEAADLSLRNFLLYLAAALAVVAIIPLSAGPAHAATFDYGAGDAYQLGGRGSLLTLCADTPDALVESVADLFSLTYRSRMTDSWSSAFQRGWTAAARLPRDERASYCEVFRNERRPQAPSEWNGKADRKGGR